MLTITQWQKKGSAIHELYIKERMCRTRRIKRVCQKFISSNGDVNRHLRKAFGISNSRDLRPSQMPPPLLPERRKLSITSGHIAIAQSVELTSYSLPLLSDCGSWFRVTFFVTALALALECCLVKQMICVMHYIARTVAATGIMMKA